MSDLKIRQLEKIKTDVIKAHKALYELTENEGWSYDWSTFIHRSSKTCCLAGAYSLKYGDGRQGMAGRTLRMLSTIALRASPTLNDPNPPTLTSLLDSVEDALELYEIAEQLNAVDQ